MVLLILGYMQNGNFCGSDCFCAIFSVKILPFFSQLLMVFFFFLNFNGVVGISQIVIGDVWLCLCGISSSFADSGCCVLFDLMASAFYGWVNALVILMHTKCRFRAICYIKTNNGILLSISPHFCGFGGFPCFLIKV